MPPSTTNAPPARPADGDGLQLSSLLLDASHVRQGDVLSALRSQHCNLHTRLLSIEHDTHRVLQLYDQLNAPSTPRFPLFANARAGSWYVPPHVRVYIPVDECAFKSADGHYGHWASSPRRPNLHVLRAAHDRGAVVVVDATRAGKRIPDALSKTLPIWCAVLNAVLHPHCPHHPAVPSIAQCTLCLPASLHLHRTVPPSEHAQIAARLPAFIDAWCTAGMQSHPVIRNARRKLRKPLRVVWVQPSRSGAMWADGIPLDKLAFTPVIALSASDAVTPGARALIEPTAFNADTLQRITLHSVDFPPRGAFSYVQGAGDDEEAWAQGLMTQRFWRRRLELLADLPQVPSNAVSVLTERVRRVVDGDDDDDADALEDGCFVDAPQPVWESGIWIARTRVASVSSLLQRVNVLSFSVVMIMGTSLPPNRRKDGEQREEEEEEEEEGDVENANVRRQRSISTPSERVVVQAYPLTDRRGKLEFKYAFGRALGPCLQVLRKQCAEDGRRVLICCTSATGDWAAGLAIAWLAWHCQDVGVGDAWMYSAGHSDTHEGAEVRAEMGAEVEAKAEAEAEAEAEEVEEDAPLYRVCVKQREDKDVIVKEVVHGTMIRFLSSFPRYQVSRATVKQVNRFFSSPWPSSSVKR